jgi:hypothetical protein
MEVIGATLLVTWASAPLWMAVRYRLLYGRWPADDQPDVETGPMDPRRADPSERRLGHEPRPSAAGRWARMRSNEHE